MASKFQIGDRVQYVGKLWPQLRNPVGTVEQNGWLDSYVVRFGPGQYDYIVPRHYELVAA